MKKKFLQYMFLGCSLMVLFSSCRKDAFDKTTETKGSGKSYVYIDGAPEVDLHFLPFTDIKTATLFTLRRDAANNADLNKSASIVLTSLDLAAYNTANGTNYTPIPTTLATQTPDASIVTSSTGITFNLAPGVFASNYSLNINGAQFDASKKYAILLAITNFSGYSKMHASDGTSLDTVLVTLGVKNIYDGAYSATGSISFPAPTAGRTWSARAKTLSTIDASTSSTEAADLGGSGYIMYLKVNADNTVLVTPAPSAPNQTIQNNGSCTYDPATKTFTLNYKYIGGTGDRVINDVLVAQ